MMKKLYYSISEVSAILNEEQHILRYWEKEFKLINPKKSTAGNRKYLDKDINILKSIKKLIRDEGISIPDAREIIEKNNLALFESIKKPVNKITNKSNNIKVLLDVHKVKEVIGLLKDFKKMIEY